MYLGEISPRTLNETASRSLPHIYLTPFNRPQDDDSGFTASVFNKFNRFNTSQKRKPQVSVPPSVGFNWGSQDSGLSSVSGGMSLGFDNPIYGTPMEVSGNIVRLGLTLFFPSFKFSST